MGLSSYSYISSTTNFLYLHITYMGLREFYFGDFDNFFNCNRYREITGLEILGGFFQKKDFFGKEGRKLGDSFSPPTL